MAVWAPLKSVLRGYSQGEASSLSISERRKRIATRVAYLVRAIYLGVQLVCLVILLQSDSVLGQSWRSQNASYAWSFLALLTLNFGSYVALCSSNPGYLPVKAADSEEAPLTTDVSAPHVSQDRLSNPEVPVSTTSGYGPLPYPTDYANYINLSALGRSSDTGRSSSSALPWWELPNPGRWCEYCSAWQPLRAKHCHICARCIRRFDHHCAWTSNCVGENNHARFWWFLMVQGVLITWALLDAISAWNLHPELDHGFMPGIQILLASVLLFSTFLFDWGLLIFHTFLLATGRTTVEHIYRRNGPVAYLQHVPKKVSAFDEGVVHNVYNICCAKGPHLYRLPPRDQLIEVAQQETVWDNRYYSCCR